MLRANHHEDLTQEDPEGTDYIYDNIKIIPCVVHTLQLVINLVQKDKHVSSLLVTAQKAFSQKQFSEDPQKHQRSFWELGGAHTIWLHECSRSKKPSVK